MTHKKPLRLLQFFSVIFLGIPFILGVLAVAMGEWHNFGYLFFEGGKYPRLGEFGNYYWFFVLPSLSALAFTAWYQKKFQSKYSFLLLVLFEFLTAIAYFFLPHILLGEMDGGQFGMWFTLYFILLIHLAIAIFLLAVLGIWEWVES